LFLYKEKNIFVTNDREKKRKARYTQIQEANVAVKNKLLILKKKEEEN